jgi:2'-5' RNA ligase
MPAYVVALPELSEEDREYVDELRARHDAVQSRLVPPHVTLVFRTERFGAGAAFAHAVDAAGAFGPFDCVFRRAVVVRDSHVGTYDVFLVPEEGRDELDRLHDALYAGALAPELRPDIAYVPHMTVARFGSLAEAQALAASIEAHGLPIHTRIARLDVLSGAGAVMVTAGRVWLSEEARAAS